MVSVLELRLRRLGVFILVDPQSKRLWFYGYKPNQTAVRQLLVQVRERSAEMVNFLIARARAKEKGET